MYIPGIVQPVDRIECNPGDAQPFRILLLRYLPPLTSEMNMLNRDGNCLPT